MPSGDNLQIFFDVDGVLIDGWHAKPERRRPWDVTMKEDLGIDSGAFRQALFVRQEGSDEAPMLACARGERDLKAVLEEILPSIGYSGSAEEVMRYWFEKDSNINNAVFDMVKRLSPIESLQLYIATGQEHHRAAYLWNDLRFREFFRKIFYSAKLGHLKSSPAFFQAINAELEIMPGERVLFFDDHKDVVATARSVGWNACQFDEVEDILSHPWLKDLLI